MRLEEVSDPGDDFVPVAILVPEVASVALDFLDKKMQLLQLLSSENHRSKPLVKPE